MNTQTKTQDTNKDIGMTPLQSFASAVAMARNEFDSGGPWITFYDAKQAAYTKLVTALPQVEGIEDFWRYVQNMPRPHGCL